MNRDRSRREFLAATAAGAMLAFSGCARAASPPLGGEARGDAPAPGGAVPPSAAAIPKRALGKTDARVSILGISILGIGGAHLGEVRDPNDLFGASSNRSCPTSFARISPSAECNRGCIAGLGVKPMTGTAESIHKSVGSAEEMLVTP